MLTEINGTIKLVGEENGQKIQLTIPGSDYEKFKEYKNIDGDNSVVDDEFFASFTLNDKRIYVTGLYPQEEQTNNSIVTVYASSIASNGSCHFEYVDNGTYNGHQLQEIKDQLGLSEDELQVNISKHFIKELKDKINALEDAKKEAEEKQQELQQRLEDLTNEQQNAAELQKQLDDKNAKIKADLEAKETEAAKLKADLEAKEEEIAQLKQQQPDAAQLQKKEGKIKELEDKIKELEAKIKQPNTEVENLKKDLQAQNSQVQQLTQKNKELEAKNKTTEQPKQSNAALYTATAGMGLAAGLIAFTALERTVRLEMLVMIGIAVTSALVVGGITYAVLPGTQVDGAKAQEVNENGKKK